MAYNDILRMRIYQTCLSCQVVNVMHFVSQNVGPPGDEPIDLANDFVTNLTTTLKARANNNTTFQYVEVQKIVPFSGGPAVVNFPGGTVGGVAEALVSATLSEVVTIYSERGGRRGRGRVYLPPGGTAGSAGGGLWQTVQLTRTQNWINAMVARYITATPTPRWMLGVWSRRSGPVFPPWTTDQFARATGMVDRNYIRNQRRRQLGVGR